MRARSFLLRHSGAVALTVLVLSVAASTAALVILATVDPGEGLKQADLVYTVCQLLPYGTVGAVLIARRPDLPFGWVLAIGALALVLVVAIAVPSAYAFHVGHGSQWALWGVSVGSLAWLPAGLEGVINLRFPSGQPSARTGRILDRIIRWCIGVVVVAGFLGAWPERQGFVHGQKRFLDATPIPEIANAFIIGVPLVILLGIAAGIGVVVRCLRSTGLERQQLQWRAVGVIVGLALFPFAVTETLPDWISDLAPTLFVATLVVPVLRYDLWAVDSIVRRSTTYTMRSGGSVLSNVVRATAEMLHLPYLAVSRAGTVLASTGEAAESGETWPLVHDGQQIGELRAVPPYGHEQMSVQDSEVLMTMAEVMGGLVLAEGLTQDLQEARLRLVTAREEERRRLRRDLHDGLGPLLTGLGLNLDAAAAYLGRDDEQAAVYLAHAQDASSHVVASLREVVYGLRPPALDDLGLDGALRQQLGRIAEDAGLRLRLTVPETAGLPAAVEVATFRTAIEAATNVARHAAATTLEIVIAECDGALTVTATDDGPTTTAWRYGVGLRGMQERAEEVGGHMHAGPCETGGRVQVTFPLGRMGT